jgi:hypothetical protein
MNKEETEGQRKRRVWRAVDTSGLENAYADMFLQNCEQTAIACVYVKKECVRHDPNEYTQYEHPAMYQSWDCRDGHYTLKQDRTVCGMPAPLKFD